jgi:osmotically-inducible protein OsmY
MRKYGKWFLVLGVLAASPSDASADGLMSRLKPRLPFSSGSDQERNQQLADSAIESMRKAQVKGEGISVEVTDGVAVLTGSVNDPAQRSLAQRAVGTVPGITRVQNDIKYVPAAGGGAQPAPMSAAVQAAPVTRAAGAIPAGAGGSGIQQVAAKAPSGSAMTRPAPAPVPPAAVAEAKGMSDGAMARQVAQSLADAGLLNYDIEVRCTSGVATLLGQVDTPAQRQAAAQAASRVAGVKTVHNGLNVGRPVAQVSAPASARGAMPMQAQPMPMQAQPMPMPMQAGPAMMPPTAVGYAPTSYNHPHLPPYAWPSYAQYPNSAAVTYPTQYSASAWPYIGPFYPYPQVPMGWREVSLEWDDGYWQLNFNKEKDKWYWVLNPSNW